MGRREKPLEPTADPVPRLAHRLRKLRAEAGSPTYRTMAQRVPYSAPTLSAAAAGERLPTLPVLRAYVIACGGDPEEWERHWYETVAEDAEHGTDEGESPYPGLARFGAGDEDRFFGRDDLVASLVDLTARRRVAAVVGASGCGKSSLLRAGLIPALRQSTGPARPAAIRILTPGERPDRTHRREAVVGPAVADRLVVERALTARIVADVADEPGGLPLMAHALREVWRRRSGRMLTEAAYEAIGGVRGAVAHTAEDVYGSLSETDAARARTLLLRLVSPGDGTADTRRPVDSADLPPGCADVLERLVAARLLTVDGTSVELAHEALIGAWPRLRAWIEGDRERLRLHRSLTEAAHAWAELDRDPGSLYRGVRLRAAREAFGDSGREGELTEREAEFLRAGIAAQEQGIRARTRSARRTRVLLGALALLVCLATVAGALAWQQSRNGHRQHAEAQARRIAGVAKTLRTSDPVTSMRLSVAAWRIADLPETREAVRSAVGQRERDAFFGDGAAAAPATARFLSADGRTLTGSTGRRVTRWALDGGRRIGAYNRPGTFDPSGYDADVSADGRLIARATRHGFRIWDLRGESVLGRPLGGDEGSGRDGRFAPSGRMFIVQHEARGDVQVWDVRRRKMVARIRGAEASAPFSVMSPDDRLLATCKGDSGPLLVRDVRTGRDLPRTWPRALDRSFCTAQEAAFAPDGRSLVVPGEGGVRTWDVRTGKERPRLELPGAYEPAVDLSADGTLGVALGDREVVLWRTADPGTPLMRHPVPELTANGVRLDERAGAVRVQVSPWVIRTLHVRDALAGSRGTRRPDITEARFSPDGRTLFTLERRSGGAGKFRLRDGHDGTVLRTLPGRMCADCGVPALAFSPDSAALAYGVDEPEGTRVRRWDLLHGKEGEPPTDVPSLVDSLVLPGNGSPPLTAGSPPGMQDVDDMKLDVWRLGERSAERNGGHSSTRLLHALRPGTSRLVLAPDGRELLSLDGGMTDVRTGRRRPALRGEDSVVSGTFSPDGRFLAVADDNGRLTLWDGRARRALAVLTEEGPTGREPLTGGEPQRVVAFSANGRYVAASDAEGSVRVWETDTPRLDGARYAGTGGPVLALGFTGEELRVMTSRGAVRGMSVTAGRAADSVCARARGGLTRQEWRTYLPDFPYRQTC
ncbi:MULTISPECIES: hypothetical protein [unclassified Streptomyces]|uniref:nSTAND1 domain-containing NTPase n=1 Tax=unclassified Streptomyces TaxID=2593676 RepID=UPI00136B92B8|nr:MULTISPECIES: hypothetical protein [unclassified Streptomyces]NEA03653.1 hypothetical protein [Streptomyces sp. SID10116]MYY84859.1 hypothetical protein [Streptomyces sp. SID335]MYZ13262.1 hypothetical protein [Streptomyces sp. SID337]NDZ92028.1 hypothetical protein [Streptomyces sp. SID10115]NEB50344.1 hypothetical protein [Streptomyces sp. SID339]